MGVEWFEVSGLTVQLVGALRHRGATWSGQVKSSAPGPSGGAFMTHFLPVGGVPRVQGARSPVPPRLPPFATPWSVHRLATVVAVAYPLCRPPDVWSPGLPAPPGPCYWLVTSGTPMGWRRGCLTAELVRRTVCYYCLGGAVPWSCVRGARGRSAGSGLVPVLASALGLLPSLTSLVVRVAGCPVRGSLPFACQYAIPRGLCVPRAPSGSHSGPRRVSVACARARAPAAYAPPQIGVARALRAVLVEGAGRALPGGSCPSAFPAPVPCSAFFALPGVAYSVGLPAWLGVTRPPAGGPDFASWLCAPWGRHEGARGGAPLAWVLGVRG